MDPDYWHGKWETDAIGFHQSRVNSRLTTFWPKVAPSTDGCVFVPLAGKSLDMLWLHERGHSVLGVELSEKAVAAFFEENGLPHERRGDDSFVEYSGIGSARGITLLVGDFFALHPAQLAHVQAFYDRASLIAMNDALRARYAEHLGRILPLGSRGLLLSIDYDQSKMQGPPFAVSAETVERLLGGHFDIEELLCESGPERLGNLKDRGLDTLTERAYRLNRVSASLNR